MTHKVGSKSNPQCFRPSYGLRYLTNNSIFSDCFHKLNGNIAVPNYEVTTLPRANPICISCIQALASMLEECYFLLTQVDNLEQSILHYTEGIFLLPDWHGNCSNITQNFFTTMWLLFWAVHNKQPKDVKGAIIYLRYLHRQSPEAFNISPDMVKESLVFALALQVGLELGDVMQDIEEMVYLVLELLNSDTWTISTVAITSFAREVKVWYERWGKGKGPPTKIIDCLWKAKIHLPDSDKLSITLACTLLNHFNKTYLDDDYKEGIAILDKFLTSHAPGDEQYLYILEIIASFTVVWFDASSKPEHLEEVIYHSQNFLP